jgi:hypothetical protein
MTPRPAAEWQTWFDGCRFWPDYATARYTMDAWDSVWFEVEL